MSLLGLSCNLIILWKLYNYEYDDENENDDGNDDENDNKDENDDGKRLILIMNDFLFFRIFCTFCIKYHVLIQVTDQEFSLIL